MSVTGAQLAEIEEAGGGGGGGAIGGGGANSDGLSGGNSSTSDVASGGVANVGPGTSSGFFYPAPRYGRRLRRRNFSNNIHEFDNIVQEFLISLSGNAAGGGNQMVFMGNPADYVFGRDGLDTIVTQLLNQMDGAGPPPLAKDKIAEIPNVEVTDEQVASKLQCSVCWELFVLGEPVRKLPCVVSVPFLVVCVCRF